jgi:hypothetical protein
MTPNATTAAQPASAIKAVPARHLREVVVRENATEDLKKRTAKEVVAAVNTASSRKEWQRGASRAGIR